MVLRGHYSCGPFASGVPDRGVIDLGVKQARRTGTVTAVGYLDPSVCDGTRQRFEVTLTAAEPLRAGAATWLASGYVEGDTGVQHVHVAPTRITLTR